MKSSATTGKAPSSNPLGSAKMFPLLIKMAVPPMLSMLIQSLYNIVDSIFVARLSSDALSAVSIIYPIQNLSLALAVGTGVGINSYIARNMGAGRTSAAEDAPAVGMILTGIHYVILTLLACLLIRPFVGMYTQDVSIRSMCYSYGYIVMIFSFGQLFHITAEKILQSTGNMTAPLILVGIGCIINIILDPIMIFGLLGFPALGVAGAAIATVTGQIISGSIGILMVARGKAGLPLRRPHRGMITGNILKQIYSVAIPSTMIMALPSILVAGLNRILSGFSQMAVTVFGVYYKLQTFVYMPANGLVQGIRPVISFNYGAGNTKRETDAVRISLMISAAVMAAGTLLSQAVPVPILQIFNSDKNMLSMGETALRIISIGFIPSALGIIASAVFESIGKGLPSLSVTLLRQLVIVLPLSFLLSRTFGLNGVWTALPVSEAITAVYAGVLLTKELKKQRVIHS
ncbi:MATE family efflux transporter [Lacrimispora sp. NSJ-141]|uniref:MATE family efflux transporter n=1 Tax=Lientehia hominis TaxID=2897778 RepID=A0AAP2W8I8_9FIRM|nr:MATE family efflux transporter [Lientehia hominis]MCD2492086.1 MATE family efflux transporter [Lientehia hominis]